MPEIPGYKKPAWLEAIISEACHCMTKNALEKRKRILTLFQHMIHPSSLVDQCFNIPHGYSPTPRLRPKGAGSRGRNLGGRCEAPSPPNYAPSSMGCEVALVCQAKMVKPYLVDTCQFPLRPGPQSFPFFGVFQQNLLQNYTIYHFQDWRGFCSKKAIKRVFPT